MKQNTVTITENQSGTFEALTIVNKGVGHRILADREGNETGDQLYVTLQLEAPGVSPRKIYIREGAEQGIEQFGLFTIAINSVSWVDGAVTLTLKEGG